MIKRIKVFYVGLLFISVASSLIGVNAQSNKVGFAEAQGLRPTMEDAHDIHITRNHEFFGLYDGHGGRKVADFAAKHLYTNVMNALKKRGTTYRTALTQGFLKTNKDLDNASFDSQYQGSTAIVAFIKKRNVYVANIGDSRAVLAHDGTAIPLSSDHKPDRPDELERIERLGGHVKLPTNGGVARVEGNLAISRALGDKHLHPYVIAKPEIRQKKLTASDDFLIIACDGVWDVIDNQQAVDIVTQVLCAHPNNFNNAADTLKEKALQEGSTDNVTVIVVNLKKSQH